MLLKPATTVAMDVARTLVWLLLLSAFAPCPAAAMQPPVAGARCYGKSLPLQANLPLGTSSPDTDVVDIHVVRSTDGSRVAAWYYLNRSGDRFVQVAPDDVEYVARLFSSAAARRAAVAVSDSKPYSFVSIDRKEAMRFERSEGALLHACFAHPLGRR